MAIDPAAPHAYVRHFDRKPGCAACGLVKADPVHGPQPEPEPVETAPPLTLDERLAAHPPRQLAMARLMELTPELRAHYACPPGTDCGHPDCQPRNPEESH